MFATCIHSVDLKVDASFTQVRPEKARNRAERGRRICRICGPRSRHVRSPGRPTHVRSRGTTDVRSPGRLTHVGAPFVLTASGVRSSEMERRRVLVAAAALLAGCKRDHTVAKPGSADAAAVISSDAGGVDVGSLSFDAYPGEGDAASSGYGYGRGWGGLGGKRAHGEPSIPIIPIRRHSHRRALTFCYESELAKNPDLAGRIEVQFTISAEGQVTEAGLVKSTMNSPPVERCVVNEVRHWSFPKPIDGGVVVVRYPFVFTSGQD